MNLIKFSSRTNLNLAWRRITANRNARYKNYFRHIYEAFELSYEENIIDLQKRLRTNNYSPHIPVRIYYPKESGLQRPITLLGIEDQIVLQGIANIFAEKVRARRKLMIGKSIFSNWPSKDPHSDFFLDDWRFGFYELRRKLLNLYKRGNTWMVNFDLAAFYDTIPHKLLTRILSPHGGNSDLTELICSCLKEWSGENKSSQHEHGIPQGPIASDFLAECIMLPIDEKMSNICAYFRYVDDIRILGQSEVVVRKASVELDMLCRDRGLIPNTDKKKFFQIRNEEELEEQIPPVIQYTEPTDEKELSSEETDFLIEESVKLDNQNIEIIDKSKLRYALFRSNKSEKLLNIVLKLWEHFPHHTDAFTSFLDNYQRVDEIISKCLSTLENSPYDFVLGESWKLLARMCDRKELQRKINMAMEVVKSYKHSGEKIGAYYFLNKCESVGLGSYSKWLMYEKSPIIQAIAASSLVITESQGLETTKKLLIRRLIDPSLSLTSGLIKSQINLNQLGIDINSLSQVTKNVYFKAGIIPSRGKSSGDPIGNILNKRYGVNKWGKWKLLFGTEYLFAHKLLVMAETYFKPSRSAWISQQDSFNDALLRSFIMFLQVKIAPGAIQIVDPNGKLIKYGTLINNAKFKLYYPVLVLNLKSIHDRRITVPTAHAYEINTGKKAIPLGTAEQRVMVKFLATAYNEIMRILISLGI